MATSTRALRSHALDQIACPRFSQVVSSFVADQLLMSVNMARSTYLKKIAVHPDHVTPTLTMSVSLDHVFSITIALLGGVIWSRWGYQMVFVLGAGIALVNLVSVQFMRIPKSNTAPQAAVPSDTLGLPYQPPKAI